MAKSDTPTRRLSDWVVLILVLVIMGLLIADLAKNVRDAAAESTSSLRGSASEAPPSDVA